LTGQAAEFCQFQRIPSDVQRTVWLSPLELAGSGQSPSEKGGECKVHFSGHIIQGEYILVKNA